MSTKNPFALMLLVLVAMSSCSGKYVSLTKQGKLQEVAHFEHISSIHLIEKGDKMVYNKALSDSATIIFNNTLQINNRVKVVKELSYTSDSQRNEAYTEMMKLMEIARRGQNLADYRITPTLDKVLEENNMRYGLITFAAGFTRTNLNYNKQLAKSVAVGLLTLGMFVPVSIQSTNNVYVMVVDSNSNKILFYNSRKTNNEPLHAGMLKGQLDTVLKGI
jgi:hypothetical protein